ncbi:MAG: hypothetical protein O2955_21535 [Planctomycetota bacterium]|nr:hypothetical protein [Planctomycetota bacterium]MDA1215091.1 hypothetical protein [Planctomycetota bacterium]
MWDTIVFTVSEHIRFYGQFAHEQWRGLTPMKYGSLLIGVAFFGWLLMKSGAKSL